VVFCVFLERTVEFAGSELFERSLGSVQYHADLYEPAACTFGPACSVVPRAEDSAVSVKHLYLSYDFWYWFHVSWLRVLLDECFDFVGEVASEALVFGGHVALSLVCVCIYQ